ncbi:GPI ethanolamine phosphate transferase 1 isoform X2 [Drosophila eugracilis]|uniref:GPI ethanolamine phosphate transferase 1 isoform X2 n=1 Tax=Drosophila eugracilis TaxID=29029 RepID=UPI001BD9E61F|nr:GPI ethanolamine phosphate transferase 1 isoform X2 [Drosophila eugracilis]
MKELGLEPPADRLVVFLTDGLRAATFLANNGNDVPDLRDIYLKQGRIGISRACAPTMTRPGHIAIFGGFNEDPTAALVNFRYYPSNFDTVFNRSRHAIGWAHRYVAGYFKDLPHGGAPMRFDSFMESELPEKLTCDKWTFEKVQKFFKNGENVREWRNYKPAVILVYLADMDIAAHRLMPLSKKFHEKLQYTQHGIRMTYELFERIFNDSRTAYLMTSDHGMSDHGMHGSGTDHQTETPLFMWGAGVSREQRDSEVNFPSKPNISVVEQTQLASLMSALIGLPPPMNNMAIMPLGYLNLAAQAKILLKRYESALFYEWLPKFEKLNLKQIDQFSGNFNSLVEGGNFKKAMKITEGYGKLLQNCLAYYHEYYQLPLMVATTGSYLVWFYCLLLQLTRLSKKAKEQTKGYMTFSTLVLTMIGILLFTLLELQNVPKITACYLVLPVGMLIMAQAERPAKGCWTLTPILNFGFSLLPAGLLILLFIVYQRTSVLYAIFVLLKNRRAFLRPSIKLFVWLGLALALIGQLFVLESFKNGIHVIPLKNSHVLYIGMAMAIVRPLILGHRHDPRVWAINFITLLVGACGVYLYTEKETMSPYVYATTWSFLVYAFLSVPYFSKSTTEAKRRLELITINMITLITLLSNSWGSLNSQLLITEFVFGHEVYEKSRRSKEDEDLVKEHDPFLNVKEFYRYGFMILLYFYVSFWLAGHWLTSFLFKSTAARLFYPHFSLYLAGSLILLKIALPSLIVICSLYGMVPFFRKNTRAILICVLIISNIMGLYKYYFIIHRGSWYFIRKSLDQILLTHVVIFMLMGCIGLAKIFLADTTMEKPKRKNVKSSRRASAPEETEA